MATSFDYWFLTKPAIPPFVPPLTPKKYIDSNFSRNVAHRSFGTLPLALSSPVPRAELVAAGLSAGYGKERDWTKTFLGPISDRASLYRYLRRRLEMTLACFDVNSGRVMAKPFWEGVEPSEKASISFNLGSLGAAISAHRWMDGAGLKVRRLLHTRLFMNASLVRSPLTFKALGDALPDYLVEDSGGGWHVFEAKGGDAGNRWRQLAQGLQQVAQVTRVGALGHSVVPTSAVCVHTLVDGSAGIEFTLVDPPSSMQGDGDAEQSPVLQIDVNFEVADILLCVEALEWFSCMADPVLLGDDRPRAVETRLQGFRFSESNAFGGMRIALPEVFFELESKARAFQGVVTEFKALLAEEEARSVPTRTAEQLAIRVRSTASRRRSRLETAFSDEGDSGLSKLRLEALAEALDQPVEGDLLRWQAMVLQSLSYSLELKDLAGRIASAREDATARAGALNETYGSNSRIGTSAGGLLVIFDAQSS